jgi:hypothetical protein
MGDEQMLEDYCVPIVVYELLVIKRKLDTRPKFDLPPRFMARRPKSLRRTEFLSAHIRHTDHPRSPAFASGRNA